jgi:hypothetical protein
MALILGCSSTYLEKTAVKIKPPSINYVLHIVNYNQIIQSRT